MEIAFYVLRVVGRVALVAFQTRVYLCTCLLQHHLQLDLITQGNAVFADKRDPRLEFARLFHRVYSQGAELEAALLIEAQQLAQVVVGRGGVDAAA